MTESSFPFEAAAEEPASSGDSRKMLLLAGVGALAVAVVGYFVVVPAFAGGSDTTTTTLVKKAPSQAKSKKAPAKPAAKKPAAQPASYDDVSGRANPFRELWVKPEAAPVQAAPAAAPGSVPVTGSSGTTAAPAGGSSTSVGGQRVALMTVFSKDGMQFAQTRVGDVVYTPRVGQVFAVSFQLLAASGTSATYLYGDEQFTLSVGQEVLK